MFSFKLADRIKILGCPFPCSVSVTPFHTIILSPNHHSTLLENQHSLHVRPVTMQCTKPTIVYAPLDKYRRFFPFLSSSLFSSLPADSHQTHLLTTDLSQAYSHHYSSALHLHTALFSLLSAPFQHPVSCPPHWAKCTHSSPPLCPWGPPSSKGRQSLPCAALPDGVSGRR